MVDLVQWVIDGAQTFVTIVLPWLVILTVVLVIGYIVSRLARTVTTRLVKRFRIDEALGRAGMESMVRSVGFPSLARFFGALVFWFVFLMFVLLALSFAPTPAGIAFVVGGIAFYIPRIIAASLIVIGGVWAGTWLSQRVQTPTMKSDIPFPPEVIGGIVKFLAVAIAGIIALNLLVGPENVAILTWTFTVAIAALFIGLGASFAWGSRNVTANLAGYLQVSRSLHVGDRIEVGDLKGTVHEVSRYVLVLRDASGREITIPHSRLIGEVVVRSPA